MPDLFLTVARIFHVGFGALATFVLFPIQIFNRKGSAHHKRVGRWLEWVTLGVAVTGGLMLLDPLFLSDFWPREADVLGYQAMFKDTYYEPLFFLFLMVTLLYYVFSGARIWRRTANADAQGRVPSGPLDWALTGAAGLFAIAYLTIGIIDVPSGQKFAWQFIAAGATLVPFLIFDLVSFVPRWSVRLVTAWWLVHVLKLFNAWHGLVDAFVLRLEVQYGWVTAHRPLVTRGVWLIEIGVVVAVMHHVRQGRFDPDGGRRRRDKKEHAMEGAPDGSA